MQKETIKINRENDDSYVIVRNIVEKVDAEAFVKIHEEIKKGLDNAKTQVDEVPKQALTKVEILKKDVNVLTERFESFNKHYKSAKRVSDKKVEERKKEEAKAGEIPIEKQVPNKPELKPGQPAG